MILDAAGQPSVDAAVAAYLSGHVPYGIGDEIVWRRPDPRYFLDLRHARFPEKVWRHSSRQGWTARVNSDFEQVVRSCAAMPRKDDSAQWMTAAIMQMYFRLHSVGLAHSIEVWSGDELIGGEFGLLVGGSYFCESKFHRASGAGNFCTGVAVLTLADAGAVVYDIQHASTYHRRFSTRGIEQADKDQFVDLLLRSSGDRFRRLTATGMSTLSRPVLPGTEGWQ